MNCLDHKNEELAYCPSCLEKYWEMQYKNMKEERDRLRAENAALRRVVEAAKKWRYSVTPRSEKRLIDAIDALDAMEENAP